MCAVYNIHRHITISFQGWFLQSPRSQERQAFKPALIIVNVKTPEQIEGGFRPEGVSGRRLSFTRLLSRISGMEQPGVLVGLIMV